jgi:hypothetical protein
MNIQDSWCSDVRHHDVAAGQRRGDDSLSGGVDHGERVSVARAWEYVSNAARSERPSATHRCSNHC